LWRLGHRSLARHLDIEVPLRLDRTQADQILVRVKNTRTGKIVDVRPTPALMDLLAAFKPQAKAGTGHGPESKADDEHLAAVARKIAAMPDKDVASLRWWREGE